MIKWEKLSKEEYVLIHDIALRAVDALGYRGPLVELEMDISATHISCPLKLKELLKAEFFDFCHDIGGIVRHLNRETGELRNHFCPRYSK